MEPIQIGQTLRPTRYAFIVDADDKDSAILGVAINTVLWGGVFNPIVPRQPEPALLGILDEFDPDVLINLGSEALPAKLLQQFAHRIIGRTEIVRTQQDEKPALTFGFGILPVIRNIQEREFRGQSEESRVVKVDPPTVGEWQLYSRFVFGTFDELPIDKSPYADVLQRRLHARVITYDPESDHEPFVDLFSPLDVTRYRLHTFGGFGSFSSHILYAGDHQNLTDLLEFWNLRATGRRVWFVPVRDYMRHEPLIRQMIDDGSYPLNPRVQNHADLQRGASVDEGVFNSLAEWIASWAKRRVSTRPWGPRYGLRIERYVGDVHVARLEAERSEEMSILHEGRMTPVRTIAPDFLDERLGGESDHAWSVDIDLRGGYSVNEWMFRFPRGPKVDEVVSRGFMSGRDPVRVGQRGVTMVMDGRHGTLHPFPVRTIDVFHALFQEAGLAPTPSKPGRYVDQIINKMGSLQFGCRVFKIRGVRDVLDRLSRGAVLTKGNMRDRVISTVADSYGRNWEQDLYHDLYLGSGKRATDFGAIFDILLETKVIRPGFELECVQCGSKDWYHVSEFAEEFTCRYCFTRNRVRFGSVREWQYKADGLFQIPHSALGSLAVILLLWRLQGVSSLGEARYLSSVELRDESNGKEYEVDCSFLSVAPFSSASELVLGQAKGFVDFTVKETTKMRELADRLGGTPFLAFATLKNSFAEEEKRLLKELAEAHYQVIALTRFELDPYDLFERFKSAPHPYAIDFGELSTNTIKLNL